MAASAILDRGEIARQLTVRMDSITGTTLVKMRQQDPSGVNHWIRMKGLTIKRRPRQRGGTDEADYADFELRLECVVGPGAANQWAMQSLIQRAVNAFNDVTLTDGLDSPIHMTDIQSVDEGEVTIEDAGGEHRLESCEVTVRGECHRISGTSLITDFLN